MFGRVVIQKILRKTCIDELRFYWPVTCHYIVRKKLQYYRSFFIVKQCSSVYSSCDNQNMGDWYEYYIQTFFWIDQRKRFFVYCRWLQLCGCFCYEYGSNGSLITFKTLSIKKITIHSDRQQFQIFLRNHAIFIKGALSGLGQFLATKSPLKWWKMFLFCLKSSFCSQDI